MVGPIQGGCMLYLYFSKTVKSRQRPRICTTRATWFSKVDLHSCRFQESLSKRFWRWGQFPFNKTSVKWWTLFRASVFASHFSWMGSLKYECAFWFTYSKSFNPLILRILNNMKAVTSSTEISFTSRTAKTSINLLQFKW